MSKSFPNENAQKGNPNNGGFGPKRNQVALDTPGVYSDLGTGEYPVNAVVLGSEGDADFSGDGLSLALRFDLATANDDEPCVLLAGLGLLTIVQAGESVGDIVDLGDGNDVFWGFSGNDIAFGGDGNDQFNGGQGSDFFFGETGNDNANGGADGDILLGGAGNDVLDGGDDDDTLCGGDDNDELLGGDGADSLEGGDGDDFLDGGEGADTLNGGAGDDTLEAGIGDSIEGGDDSDTISFKSQTEGVLVRLDLGAASLESDLGTPVFFFSGFENVRGSNFDDGIFGDDNANVIEGCDGSDTLRGLGGDDVINGGDGNDTITGESGNDTLTGGEGSDFIRGLSDNDVIDGGDGDDAMITVSVIGFDDVVIQGGLYGSSGDDTITGGEGADLLVGGGDNDVLDGGAGDDRDSVDVDGDTVTTITARLDGGAGDDTITGGEGADLMIGGTGSDVFVYNASNESFYDGSLASPGDAADQIVDFDTDESGDGVRDLIDLSYSTADTYVNAGGIGALALGDPLQNSDGDVFGYDDGAGGTQLIFDSNANGIFDEDDLAIILIGVAPVDLSNDDFIFA